MNPLQGLPDDTPLFVTLNPHPAAPRHLHTRDLSAPAVRCRGDGGPARTLVAAGPTKHLVLRRLFRGRLPRGRATGGAGRRRSPRRRSPAWRVDNESGRIRRAARAPPLPRWRPPHERLGLRPLGVVMHQRLRPRRHRLGYRIFQMLIDLDELPRAGRLAAAFFPQPNSTA